MPSTFEISKDIMEGEVHYLKIDHATNASDLFIHSTVCHPTHYCRSRLILWSVCVYVCAAGGRQEVKRVIQ